MPPLDCIAIQVYNTYVESWACCGSVSSSTAVGPLLQEAACINSQTRTHASLSGTTGIENKETYTASRLKNISISQLLRTFKNCFPQWDLCRLCLLPCAEKHWLLTIIHTKRLPQDSPFPPSGRILPHEHSGRPFSYGCASQANSRTSEIPSLLNFFPWKGALRGPCSQP